MLLSCCEKKDNKFCQKCFKYLKVIKCTECLCTSCHYSRFWGNAIKLNYGLHCRIMFDKGNDQLTEIYSQTCNYNDDNCRLQKDFCEFYSVIGQPKGKFIKSRPDINIID